MLVEFILPTFDRIDPLRVCLSSLKAQTNPDWMATVVIDDNGYFGHENAINIIRELNATGIPKIQYFLSGKRYNDWGHTPRELGKQASTANYICMGGDDNYYTPNFVEELYKATGDKPGMVYWDMVHSHYDYSYFKCSPNFNQIDMGAFATRVDLAQQIPLGTEYAADGLFIEEFKKRFPYEEIVKIDKVLFIHN